MTKRVLITAGAAGIGLAIAQAFLAAGDRVHIFDIDEAAISDARARHPELSATLGDVTRAADVDRLVSDVQGVLGGVDVLVSNAGIAGPTAPVEEYDPDAWNAVVDVNLTGTFKVVRKVVPLLKKQGHGTVIIMSSLAGRFGYPNRIAYSTTKWGLIGLTKTLSLELGPHGITVNSLHPGAVTGPRLDRVFEGRAEVSGRTVDDERQLGLENQAIKQFTDPADIAALAVFLASPAGRTISGQQLSIDGDSKAAQ